MSWDFESETFKFPIERGTRFYTPDFKVIEKDGSATYYEIKGYMDPRSATKLKRMAKYYPHIKIVLVDKKAYYSFANKVGGFIPGWETIRGKFARVD